MTTIVTVRRNGVVAMGGDGQVTMGQSTILKGNAIKVRKVFHGKVIAGFAGSTADAFTLLDLFEKSLKSIKAFREGFNWTGKALALWQSITQAWSRDHCRR